MSLYNHDEAVNTLAWLLAEQRWHYEQLFDALGALLEVATGNTLSVPAWAYQYADAG